MNVLFEKTKVLLYEVQEVLNKITDQQFITPIGLLNQATIGQHTRHILEFFECLIDSSNEKILDYDDRKRNKAIETNKNIAIEAINNILNNIDRENLTLKLLQKYVVNDQTIPFYTETTYHREWVYNLEHTIHHQALLRVAVHYLAPEISIGENFGVADSTISFKKSQKYAYVPS